MSWERELVLLPLLLLLLATSVCQGRGSGAPNDACNDMTPRHPGSQPQPEATFPYQLQVTPKTVQPGGRSVTGYLIITGKIS